MGILQRYVWKEVSRAFALALLTMTIIFVLFMVAAQAMQSGLLTPGDVVLLVPYVIPSTLPYTMPVSLLFAVTVVYGRIAGDNEIIAVKSAGLSVMTVVWPAIVLGAVASAFLWAANRTWIPGSAHQAKLVLFRDREDLIYKLLKKNKELMIPRSPIFVKVRDVEDRDLIDPTFKRMTRDPTTGAETCAATIQARRARLRFDVERRVVVVHLEEAEVQNFGADGDVTLLPNNTFEFDFPDETPEFSIKAIQEHTNKELDAELARAREHLAGDRKRRAMSVGLNFAAGKFDDVKWAEVAEVFAKKGYWVRRNNELETEKQLRVSMAFGSLLFVILGAPVGIRFAKRDFLSAFMTCFLPIIGLYYPLMLFGINMGKEGTMEPHRALWIGNVVLAAMSGWVYPRIIKY